MTQIIMYKDEKHPTVVPTTIEFEKTLRKHRDSYDIKLIRTKRKLNTWDNPNAGYIKKKDRK